MGSSFAGNKALEYLQGTYKRGLGLRVVLTHVSIKKFEVTRNLVNLLNYFVSKDRG